MLITQEDSHELLDLIGMHYSVPPSLIDSLEYNERGELEFKLIGPKVVPDKKSNLNYKSSQ